MSYLILKATFSLPNCARGYSNHHHRGFTLIELLVTVSLLLVLALIATPSLAGLMSRTELDTNAAALHQSLNLARTRAITTQQTVHLCQLSQGSDVCEEYYASRRSWGRGWLVFVDNNENNSFDEQDELLRVMRLNGKTNIVFNQRGRLRFFPDGSSRSAGFYLCSKDKLHHKHLYLLYSGRARIKGSLTSKNLETCANTSV